MLRYKLPKNKKYMVLESDIECVSKAIHVIDFSLKAEFNVGRRVTNDITVSDILVSRQQSVFRYIEETDKVYV